MAPTINKTINEAAQQITRDDHTLGSEFGEAAGPITFAFRASSNFDLIENFSRFNDDQIAATERALDLWSDVANITFTRVLGSNGSDFTNDARILFGNYNMPGFGGGYSFDDDVWFNRGEQDGDVSLGSFGFLTLVHEIGHVMGLEHPGDYNANFWEEPTNYDDDAEYVEDSLQFTVMSYFEAFETGASHRGVFAATPLLHDITAAQRIYGANMSTRTGDTTYGFNSNAGASFDINDDTDEVVFAVWDAGGVDTFDFSGYGEDEGGEQQNQTIDLRAGKFSSVGELTKNVAIAQGVTIENARGGSGDDTITGNGAANRLQGINGNDVMSGGNGGDTLEGGNGDDELTGGDGADWLYGGNDNDELSGGNHNDELRGEAGNDDLSGNNGNDRLEGGSGNDTLEGGAGNDRALGGYGNDVMGGGSGADTLFGESGNEVMSGGTGNDTLWAGGGTDYVTGGDGDDELSGGDGADHLYGGNNNDDLSGGNGNDQLFGGNHNDALDGGAGDDRLDGGAGHDGLDGGTGIDRLFGGAGNNSLKGGAGNDQHYGGTGADNMSGGAGDDSYYVDNVGDTVSDYVEVPGEPLDGALVGLPTKVNAGVDVVYATAASFTLGAFVEKLVASGPNAFAGTGNNLNNTIEGNSGADTLKGLAGNDVLIGRGGRDVLYGGKADPAPIEPGFNVQIDAQADVFKYLATSDTGTTATTRDRIADFEHSRDHIDLSAIDARTTKASLLSNDAFSFIGTDDFGGVAGELRYEHVTTVGRVTSTIVEGDTDGNGIANFQIELTGRHTLSSADLVL